MNTNSNDLKHGKRIKMLQNEFPSIDKERVAQIYEENNYELNKTIDELIIEEDPTNTPITPVYDYSDDDNNESSQSSDQDQEEEKEEEEQEKENNKDEIYEKKENEIKEEITKRNSLDEKRDSFTIEEKIILNTKIKNNSIEINYYIPKKYLTSTTNISLYDKFETNINNFIKQAFCNGKTQAYVVFNNLKRGKYLLKLFLKNNEKEIESKEIVIGNEIEIQTEVIKSDKKKELKVTLKDIDCPYWLGIFEHSISPFSNNKYLQSTSFKNEKDFTMDISKLKVGKYQCRIFCKDSTDGILFKQYHSIGEELFCII